MSKSSPHCPIRLRGVRHNNLKNFDLDLPLNQLIVVTGLSGSGKSSLAFDTLFAEGQRRYIETFSPYARQFFDRMDKPRVDRIEGIPPAIAIEQRNSVKSTRSTVGTMTEICDYLKLLWPHLAQLHCRQCGRPVRKDSPQQVWQTLVNAEHGMRNTKSKGAVDNATTESDSKAPADEYLITFDVALTDRISLEESLSLIVKQGYQRLLLPATPASPPPSPTLPFRSIEENLVRTANTDSVGRSPVFEIALAGQPRESSFARTSETLELNEVAAPWGGQTEATSGRQVIRVEEAVGRLKELKSTALTVVQDRIRLSPANRARFAEACEQAYHFGKGRLAIHLCPGSPLVPNSEFRAPHSFSSRLHCAQCDIEYREPSPALFSFNHPVGACPACRGFGRIISIDYHLAIPDQSKTLAGGAVRPWQTGVSADCQQDMMKFCKLRQVPVDVPFAKLAKKWQDWVIDGDPGYGQDKAHEWPRAWYGVRGYFRWLESKAYKMHVRVLLSRYRSYTPCPDCHGKRFQPETLLYRVRRERSGIRNGSDLAAAAEDATFTLADFYQLPVRDALRFIEQLAAQHVSKASDPLSLILGEVRSRLGFLADVGLDYLTLDRSTRSLSGGETERVSLTTCLGTRLVNTLYVLDEPSVGLHPRDTRRLIGILHELRNLGNTVVVVEHEASVIRAADQIVDLGPGHGESGGQVVFQGSIRDLLKSKESLTGQYLSGRRRVEIPQRRPVDARTANGHVPSPSAATRGRGINNQKLPASVSPSAWLGIHNAQLHNLKNLTVEIPLGRFVCITGVSGSGKTTLVREVVLPALEAALRSSAAAPTAGQNENESERDDEKPENGSRSTPALTGTEPLGRAVLVDQSPLGRTPRSNPAVYIGAFDDIRELFAQTEVAKQRGLNASAFSFNSSQGQCERCRGAGFEKIEMQFLSDVFIRCSDCHGRRYRPHILEVKVRRQLSVVRSTGANRDKSTDNGPRTTDTSWSIADLLDATVDEAIGFLASFVESRHAKRAARALRLLQEVGLGYLRLGQPINTLSGGESQRLKLVSHLAEVVNSGVEKHASPAPAFPRDRTGPASPSKPILFLFDEPTTGLHFDDVRVLLQVFQRLVDAGHSVLVIEHNLDVIKCADWVIDLGPEAGDEGGRLVACGTPETIAACEASHTGRFLRDVLSAGPGRLRRRR